MHKANKSILKLYACRHAKNAITSPTDIMTDNLRFSVYLKNTLKKNMNGMNFTNSSLISENTDEIMVIMDSVDSSINSPPVMSTCSSNVVITKAYRIYPPKRATARPTSLSLGF